MKNHGFALFCADNFMEGLLIIDYFRRIYMKKSEKVTKRVNSTRLRRKFPQKIRKKPQSWIKKRFKKGFRDRLWALILAGSLIAVSAVISLVIITVHSSVNKFSRDKPVNPDTEMPVSASVAAEEHPAPVPEASQPAPARYPAPLPVNSVPEKPVISITVQPPATTNAAPAVIPAAIPSAPPQRLIENRGALVFVIDDAGNNLSELEPFLSFPGPLTIAVLPGLPNSAEAARRIRSAGKEVFLHQPMEALGGQAPGPGAIYSGMTGVEILDILKRNVAEVGPVAGINNHQGSKITMDEQMMETVLAFCAEHKLHFLDSRTTAETVVPAAAKRLGMKIAERDVFIDNEQGKEAIVNSITGGLVRAQERGGAVMIGHTWSPQLAPSLTELYPELTKQGYSFMSASAMISNRVK